jgi:hypothetical protein
VSFSLPTSFSPLPSQLQRIKVEKRAYLEQEKKNRVMDRFGWALLQKEKM